MICVLYVGDPVAYAAGSSPDFFDGFMYSEVFDNGYIYVGY
jgi:hypothetical protein